jgi:hypothetical protein
MDPELTATVATVRAPGHREHQDRSIVISQIGRS